jgi:hypothetical protein
MIECSTEDEMLGLWPREQYFVDVLLLTINNK